MVNAEFVIWLGKRKKMARLEQIQQYRITGKTYQEIGILLGISRQRVEQILKPERLRAYRKTPKYKTYARHRKHLRPDKKFKNCERCNYV